MPGAWLCLWCSAWVLGRQGRAWGLQESGLSLPFCCSASLRFSSSRFLETKPRRQRRKMKRVLPFQMILRFEFYEELPHHRRGLGRDSFHNFPIFGLFSTPYSSEDDGADENLIDQALPSWGTHDGNLCVCETGRNPEVCVPQLVWDPCNYRPFPPIPESTSECDQACQSQGQPLIFSSC